MTDRPPLVVVLAGPNGAGKSTSASDLLRGALEVDEFVNADTIAQGLSAYRPEAAAVTAGRILLARIRFLARERRDFAFETTLAGRGHARFLGELGKEGYRRHMVFISLPSPDLCVARVADRVRRGGHAVPPDVIARRYVLGLKNLFEVYPSTLDSMQVYDNAAPPEPRIVAERQPGGGLTIADEDAWNRLRKQS